VKFADRVDAGRQLARLLEHLRADEPVVAGLPRGGVIVAAEVAAALGAPLDVLVVRKLGAPNQPELAIGAIGEGGVEIRNEALVDRLGLSEGHIGEVAARERDELDRRVAAYRAARPAVPLEGRTVIVVDDGLATGATAEAALHVVRARDAARVVLAIPVAPPETIGRLREIADEIVAVTIPRDMTAIGLHYRDFTQVTDEAVLAVLKLT
jgi:predicted phosphoribosyltransferase